MFEIAPNPAKYPTLTAGFQAVGVGHKPVKMRRQEKWLLPGEKIIVEGWNRFL